MRIGEIRPRPSSQVTRSLGCKCSFANAPCSVIPPKLQRAGGRFAIAADSHSGEIAAPPSIADTPKNRAAFQVGQNVLFTPLKCSECLQLQVVVLHSRGCKRHVWRPGERARASREIYSRARSRDTRRGKVHRVSTAERPRDAHCHALSSDLRAYTRVGSF